MHMDIVTYFTLAQVSLLKYVTFIKGISKDGLLLTKEIWTVGLTTKGGLITDSNMEL